MAAAARLRVPHSTHTLLVRSLATEAAAATPTSIKPPFDKILIANRGEIACRVMRTAQRLGVKCVAVYSEADRNSLHVKLADEAYCIGPAPSADSYLRMDKIIDVAKRTGAQAIHPGYGFLSENATFATELANNDLVFIGPPASAIDAMGSKSESKKIMEAAGVPCVPGYHGDNQDPKFLKEQCAKIGYPVLIKAIKGGGGKGMRIVETEADFDMMLESAQREAVKAFGDGRVLVEKYLETPRHVEVQVFADGFGEAVYLFERDCSVQRRHQKTIEEAPAPDLSEEVRRALGEKAVAAAKAVNYRGAGTVEFIMDANTKQFYFMEMNTRLQVEHPVTEMITGTDLVEWQLQVAAGNPLPKRQSDLRINGWSFEARIYAENPANQFLPDTGPLLHMSTPEPSASVRVETGVRQGDEVSVFYDPMIAKAVVHGKDRAAALAKLAACLDEYKIVGLHTNIEFLKNLARHPEFKAGNVETGFIPKYKDDLIVPYDRPAPEAVMQAALAITLGQFEAQPSAQSTSPWTALAGMRLNMPQDQTIQLVYGDVTATATVSRTPNPSSAAPISVHVSVPGTPDTTFVIRSATYDRAAREMKLDLGTHRTTNTVVTEGDMVHVFASGTAMGAPQHGTVKVSFSVPEPRYLQDIHKAAEAAMGTGAVKTPMPCKIAQVLVKPGDAVKKGQVLVVLEAMKMEHVMRAPKDAVVERVIYKVGDLVEENKLLVGFKEE
ncbi:3-methylcrotonoyl-CoA carboxylase subunit alpha [Catenaria anguillulae PL171]|uniref:3-methylcrotonoyl-CoA carboxylase subunit alpha n=1 Tax=Catenaria anguillulae PL171 TaxID=765915 RepID=A0A1Y2HHG4_9FUNG|nr:3-methylcrotonoyl-CoA carboxylase subunit alpha [Catenaria anguillulae PL171]